MYGDKITQLRKAANMTQGQLGELLNVSPQAVSKWEHNLSEPDLATMKKISTIFNISLDDFLNIESNIVGEDSNPIDADKVATMVSNSVTNAVNETMQNQPKTLGYCVSCGTIVTEENLGIASPKITCKKCYAEQLENEKTERANLLQKKEMQLKSKKKDRTKSILGAILPTIFFMAIAFLLIVNSTDAGTSTAFFFIALLLSYMSLTLSTEICMEGPASNVILWFIRKPFRLPGVIFEFSLDGLFFLIGIKLLFAVIGFLIGTILFIIGLIVGAIVSPFTFPFTIRNYLRDTKTLRQEIQELKN